MTPRVSIIIPCFNYGTYLKDAIASAAAQSHSAVEIIVVDDASTENSTKEALEQIDPNCVHLIRNRSQQGVSIARNIAIDAASGPYILPLDADDKLDPKYLETTLPLLEKLEAEVVYTDTVLFGNEDGILNLPPFSNKIMMKGNVVVSTALFRKSLWSEAGGYATSLTQGFEDWDFWLSLIENGARFKKIDKPLFHYRKHGPSRSTLANTHGDAMVDIIRKRHPKLPLRDPRLVKSRSKTARFFQSIKFKIRQVFSETQTKRISPSKRAIKIHYFNPPNIKNFGDQLNVSLLQTLLGRPVSWAKAREATHVCIGSMLEAFHPTLEPSDKGPRGPLQVWGTGFIAPRGEHPNIRGVPDAFSRPLRAYAVRGQLSLLRLSQCGVDTSQTVLGDPGLLVSRLFDARTGGKDFSVGIVPHYVDYQDPRFLHLKTIIRNSTIINVLDPVEIVVRNIGRCEGIISSSLHGLIIADSLRIPSLHVIASNKLTGGSYKFEDYHSAVGTAHLSVDMNELPCALKANPNIVRDRPLITPTHLHNLQNGLLSALFRMESC